jgi:hypothetical protein
MESMMNHDGMASSVPRALRDRIAADLQPVRRLRRPWQRAGAVLPLGLVLLFGAPLVVGLRADATQLGWTLTWGVSLAQLALGVALVAMALREAIPGRALSPGVLGAVGTLAVGGVLAATVGSWLVSPTRILEESPWFVWKVCFGYTVIAAVPVVFFAGLLVARAYPLRPHIAGALYGLGAGLLSDAGWRLFCNYSEPLHVLGAHFAGIVAATLTGAALGTVWRPRR